MPEIDWSEQIPKRGDQRQMENWQRLGVFAAGLALDDAGLKTDADACSSMDMIVAAGGGERDIKVDSLIVDEATKRNDRSEERRVGKEGGSTGRARGWAEHEKKKKKTEE